MTRDRGRWQSAGDWRKSPTEEHHTVGCAKHPRLEPGSLAPLLDKGPNGASSRGRRLGRPKGSRAAPRDRRGAVARSPKRILPQRVQSQSATWKYRHLVDMTINGLQCKKFFKFD